MSLCCGGRRPAFTGGATLTGGGRIALLVAATLALGAGTASAGTGSSSSSTTLAVAHVPPPNQTLFRLALSGVGSHFAPPRRPTAVAYTDNCQALVDTAFAGKCVIASGPAGTVAGVVEEEVGAFSSGARQERDLVWHRRGDQWVLAEVHVSEVCLGSPACSSAPGLPTLLWSDDIERDHDPKLVFVLPTARPGFGSELDVVEGTGQVALVRFLGQGFAIVPAAGGLVTYVPGSTEARPADAYFDQVLIGFAGGHWRVFSQQYLPYAAALALHKSVFSDPRAVPAAS